MKRKYVIGLDGSGIDEFIRGIEEYKEWLKRCTKTLIQRLADEGYEITAAGFQKAQYDGTNDSAVSVENRGEKVRAVVAVGSSVLFIEFGTGITYPDDHPEAAKHGMVRGGYGQGHGSQTTWGYYGDPGTHGHIRSEGERGQLVTTHGNPANKPMYEAVKQLERRLPELVREVFNSD